MYLAAAAAIALVSSPANTPAAKPDAGKKPAAAVATPQKVAETEAKAWFEKFVALGEAYDPAVADLYDDTATIKNKRTYPTGQVKELSIPAPAYKSLLRSVMPTAKERGDRSTYSNCRYTPEGERVRIACDRFSELKKYTSPYSLLIGKGTAGSWLIFEEISESRP